MGILDFFSKKNNGTGVENTVSYGASAIDSFFGNATDMNAEEAMKIPSVATAVELISSSIGQLQFMLVKKDEKTGEVTRKTSDNRLYLLNKQPNETMDAYTFKKAMVKDYLLYGASNSVIERTLNRIDGLYLLPSDQVSVQVYIQNGYKKYAKTYLNNASGSKTFNDYQLLTILKDSKNGLTGNGILKQNPEILRLALTETRYSENILKNGALPVGVLQAKAKLSDKALRNLKASWSKLYQGADKAGKTVILEEGLEYKPISMNPNELQLTEVKKSVISDVARIFNIPESMINSSSNKYGSGEQQSLVFLQNCINPIVSAIENAVNKELLLESEKLEGYSFKLDATKLVQVTRKERADAIKAEFDGGLISFWEARSELDRAKTVEEDYFNLSLGSVLYKYKKDEMVIPNTMQSKATIEQNEKLKQEE